MKNTANKILTTVNAPFAKKVTADQLAVDIADLQSAETYSGPVFAFFSEVSPDLQVAFIEEWGVDRTAVQAVALKFQEACGYELPLAAPN